MTGDPEGSPLPTLHDGKYGGSQRLSAPEEGVFPDIVPRSRHHDPKVATR